MTIIVMMENWKFYVRSPIWFADHEVWHRNRTPAHRPNPLNQIIWWIQISTRCFRRRRISTATATPTAITTTVNDQSFRDRRSTTPRWWGRSQPNTTIPMSESETVLIRLDFVDSMDLWHLILLQFTNAQNFVVCRVENQADTRGLDVEREKAELASAGKQSVQCRLDCELPHWTGLRQVINIQILTYR